MWTPAQSLYSFMKCHAMIFFNVILHRSQIPTKTIFFTWILNLMNCWVKLIGEFSLTLSAEYAWKSSIFPISRNIAEQRYTIIICNTNRLETYFSLSRYIVQYMKNKLTGHILSFSIPGMYCQSRCGRFWRRFEEFYIFSVIMDVPNVILVPYSLNTLC